MNTSTIQVLMIALALLQAKGDAGGPNRIAVRSMHLSLVLDPGLGESSNFTGVENVKHEASLMCVEIPTPQGGDSIQEFDKQFTPERLRTRGFLFKSRENGTQNGQSTLLLKGEVRKNGETYMQWIFLMGCSEPRAAQVVATAPAAKSREVEESFKLMLASVSWEKQLAATTAKSYYTLVVPPGWKLARRFGPLDLYNETGRFPVPAGESALGVVNLNEKPASFRAFVKANNLKRNHYTDLKELETKFLKIDGVDANISHVSAIHVEDRKPVILQYSYIFSGETVILIEGNRTSKLPKETFEDVCASFKFTRQDNEGEP
jgi:hypothetical protein